MRQKFLRPSPRVLVCVPCGSTQVERRAIKESALGAGAREVYLIEEPMGGRYGCGFTGGRSQWVDGGLMWVVVRRKVAIISLSGIVYAESVRIGGRTVLDEAIINYVRRNYGSLIGETTAEAYQARYWYGVPE